MAKVFTWVVILIMLNQSATAQFNSLSGIWGSPLHKARQLYKQQMYEEAIAYYLKDLTEGNYHEEAALGIANSYWMIGDYEMARNNYSIVAGISTFPEPMYKLRYAESLLSTGDLEQARHWYEEYQKDFPQDVRVSKKLEAIESYGDLRKDSSMIVIIPIAINTAHNEFAMVPYAGGYVFSSSRDQDLIIRHDHLREEERLLDLYFIEELAEAAEPTRVKLPHHWRSNDGPVAIGEDLIAVARNDVKERESTRQLGIYFMEYTDEKTWGSLKAFPENSKSHSITHPSFAGGTDTLFFSSNMSGGFGGYDLYMSFREPDGWSQPLNLGKAINTEGDESFPFFDRDTLYFASNGQVGLGGLDMYYTVFAWKKERKAHNLGYPANTGWDDFAPYIKNGEGYFTSNRPGGKGRDDIYQIEISFPKFSDVSLIISDQLNLSRVGNVQIMLSNQLFDTLLITDDAGRVQIRLMQGSYELRLHHTDYHSLNTAVDLNGKEQYVDELYIHPSLIFENISLDSILFELDEFRISGGAREEIRNIINIMNDYPHLNLRISAHTDSRGEADYNLWLSEMRAASTANFLIEQGVDPKRIEFHGYGEEKLLNDCKETKDCTEQEHSLNRRIEFQFF